MPQDNSAASTSVKMQSEVNSNSQVDDSFYKFCEEIRKETTYFAPTKSQERLQRNLQFHCLERVILLAGMAQYKTDYLEPLMLPGLCAKQNDTTLFVLHRVYSADWVTPFISALNKSLPKINARPIKVDNFVDNYSHIIINSYPNADLARVQAARAVRGTLNTSTIIAVDTNALSDRVLPLLAQQVYRYPYLSVRKVFSGIKLPVFTAESTLETVNNTFLGDVLFNLLQDNAKKANELSTWLKNSVIPYDLHAIINNYLAFTLYPNEIIQLMRQPNPYTKESSHHITLVDYTEFVSVLPYEPTRPEANPFFKMLFNYFNLLQPGLCFFSKNQIIFEATLLLNDTLSFDLESTLVTRSELCRKHSEINFLTPLINKLKDVYAADCLGANLIDNLLNTQKTDKNALKLSIAKLIDHLQIFGLTGSSKSPGLIADIKKMQAALLKHYPQTTGFGALTRTPVNIYSLVYTTSRELDGILMSLMRPSLLEDFEASMSINSTTIEVDETSNTPQVETVTSETGASGKRHLIDASKNKPSKRTKASPSATNRNSFWDSSFPREDNDSAPKPRVMIYKTI